MTVKKRYPLQALADILGADLPSLSRTLGISGSTWKEYRDRGVSEKVADRLASKVGRHPAEIWPEMVDEMIAAHEREEEERRERERGWAREWFANKYRTDPEFREQQMARSRAYYAECTEYVKARERARYAANADRLKEASRANYRANREARLAQKRAYYQANRAEIIAKNNEYKRMKRSA